MDMLTGKFRLRLQSRFMKRPFLILQTGWIDTGIATTPNTDDYWDRYTHWYDSSIEDIRNTTNLGLSNMEIVNGYVAVDSAGRPIPKRKG